MISGLAMLPSGTIIDNFHEFILESGIVIVPVSTEIADHAGFKKADLLRGGRTLHMADLLIGATAAVIKGTEVSIATANEKDFDCWGLELINPI